MAQNKRYAPHYAKKRGKNERRTTLASENVFECARLKYEYEIFFVNGREYTKPTNQYREAFSYNPVMEFMYGVCRGLMGEGALYSNFADTFLFGMKDLVLSETTLEMWDNATDVFGDVFEDLISGIIVKDYMYGRPKSKTMRNIQNLTIADGKKLLDALEIIDKTSWFAISPSMVIMRDTTTSVFRSIRGQLVGSSMKVRRASEKSTWPYKRYTYTERLGHSMVKNMWLAYNLTSLESLNENSDRDNSRRSGLLSGERRNTEDAGVPAEWTCDPEFYNDTMFCDCDCGAWDPDCDLPDIESDEYYNCDYSDARKMVIGCNATGGCMYKESPIPPEWTCDPSYYNTSDGCDCGCGIIDPDCYKESIIFGCDDGAMPSCNASGLCEYIEIPAEWTCPESYYGSGDGCDCGCGVQDPDCDNPTVEEMFKGIIPYNCEAGEDVKCVAGQCTYGRLIPSEWTCDSEMYGDEICDCDCGAWDIDCDTTINDNYTVGETLVVQGCPCMSMQCVNDEVMGPTCEGSCGNVVFFAPVNVNYGEKGTGVVSMVVVVFVAFVSVMNFF